MAAEAADFASAAKDIVETQKEVVVMFGKSLGLERYAATLEKLARDLGEVNQQLDAKEQKIGEELTTAQNLARRSLDAAVECVLVIKTLAEPVRRVIDRILPEQDSKQYSEQEFKQVERRLPQLIRKFIRLAAEAHSKLDAAKSLMNQAQDAFTRVNVLLQNCIGAMERKSKQIQAELDAAIAQENVNYAWAAFGLLGGPIGLAISYSITAGITEGLTKPQIKAEFDKQMRIFNGYKQHFEEQQRETEALSTGLHQKYKQLSDVDVKLQAAKGAAEDTLEEDWESKKERDLLMDALVDFQISLKALIQSCVKFLSVAEAENQRVEAHKKRGGDFLDLFNLVFHF